MKVVFFGTPDFAVPSLDALIAAGHEVVLVVAQPDRPAGRGLKLKVPPVVERAREQSITTLQPAKIRSEEFLDTIRAGAPDIGVVVAYGRILPQALLDIPRLGFINVHASLLPKFRGAAPIQRAIEAGETTTGVTIMRVDAELDHGPVLAVRETPIGPDELAPALAERLSFLGGETLVAAIGALASGRAEEVEQDHALATIAPKIQKSEGRVDWSRPARSIYDSFRAFHPWPGLFTIVSGETVKLAGIAWLDEDADREPGTICEITRESVLVATGKGRIEILQLQRSGKTAQPAASLATVLNLAPGSRLDPS